MRIIPFAALALICAGTQLHATNYYIDYAEGADSREGTSPATAWKHCPGDPAATDRTASVALAPGDVVRFKGGVTYVLTEAPGIELRWDGANGQQIVYDGNKAGTWGSGRARVTDNYSAMSISAFTSSAPRRHVAFTSFEFSGIGGAASLPANEGSALAPRFGGGIRLAGGAEDVTIERSEFRELGYWFNTQPMSRSSISGSAILSSSASGLRVNDCEFSRVATPLDFSSANSLQDVSVRGCRFGEATGWPVDLPLGLRDNPNAVAMTDSTVAEDSWFDRSNWSGFGEAPLETLRIAPVGGNVTLHVAAIADPSPSFQWRRNGESMPGQTQASLVLDNLSLGDSAVYTAVASNAAGSTVSNAAVIVVVPTLAYVGDLVSGAIGGGSSSPAPVVTLPPSFTQQPAGQTLTAGQSVTLSVAATGTPEPTLQWWRGGAPLNGATSPTFTIASATVADSGDYYAIANNSAGSATSQTAAVHVLEPAPTTPPNVPTPQPVTVVNGAPSLVTAQLISVGDEPATVEFTVAGDGLRPVLVRAVGPALAAFHLVGALADPRLELSRHGERVAENDNWGGDSVVRSAASSIGTFPLADGNSADSALVYALPPGRYRATVSRGNGSAGLVWVDVYEFR